MPRQNIKTTIDHPRPGFMPFGFDPVWIFILMLAVLFTFTYFISK